MTQLVAGNRFTLLTGGIEYFPALEAAFDAAQSEIHVETYIFDADAAGRRIAQALARAAQRGVATHLMVDGYGSKKLGWRFVARLKKAGVRFLVYRPDIISWPFQRSRLRRMHRKVVVIDARIAFVGGINVIDDMHTPGHTPPRFDYAVRVEGPLLAAIYPAVKRLWSLVAFTQFGQDWHGRPALPAEAGSRGGQRGAFVIRDNLRHRRDIEDAYLAAIDRARSEVLIANAYFLPGLAFRHALMDAAARGVRVMLLLQARVEYVLMHYASRALYGAFLDAGIEIHEYHRSFLHAKVAVIDGRWATVGSSNIDPLSFFLAREANIVVEDREFAGDLRARLLDAMATGAIPVPRERWLRPRFPVRAAIWFAYGVARLSTGFYAYERAREFT
jgi:cardiolipin synthase